MVVKKQDVLNADANHVQQALTKYESHADARLELSGEVTVRLEGEPDRFRCVIGEELKRRYEEAGWTVSIESGRDPRGEHWYNVEIS